MKKTMIVWVWLISCITLHAQEPNLISGRYPADKLKTVLIPQASWTPFPRITDRSGWAKADPAMMKAFLAKAESYLSYNWPSIPATKSLLIQRTGDREQYQKISFEKREVLGTLLLAEIYENKGRFIDQIADGVWNICEESWWGVPAHLPGNMNGLMDVTATFVDLFSAETGTYLAWVDYFVGDKLDAVSPQIRKRIYIETNNRIFQPLMTKPHGWMTTTAAGRRPNNWNPWICSNWLNTVLLLEKDETKRTAAVSKILWTLDEFTNPYPQDGGCDEGPGYWGAAAASLYDNIAMLNLASNNAFKYVLDDEKIKNMGRFIYRAQIGPDYFLNFADADPRPGMSDNMIYRYGKDINDTAMMQFAAYYRKPETGTVGKFMFFRHFFSLFMQEEYRNAPKALPLPAYVWLPDIEVMIARDKAGTTDGLFVAAKGGNNDESHNHNDIGNYVVYYNGLPVLIDVGRGTYTKKTFSDKRYDIWYNCSNFHNVPSINGATQPPGASFKAGHVSSREDKAFAELKQDIAKSYPTSAGVKQWNRIVRLNRGKNVTVTDQYTLSKTEQLTQHLMTCYPAAITSPGVVTIHYAPPSGTAKDFTIRFNPSALSVNIEKVPLTAMEDKGVQEKWGDNIYRINFTQQAPKVNGNMSFVITPQ